MSKYVNEKVAQEAINTGIKVGQTEPSRETKWSWWEVYKTDAELIACVLTEDGVSCGEKISLEELPAYVDDPESARLKFKSTNSL